jgi:cytochrome c-type biogenesis protein CcmE
VKRVASRILLVIAFVINIPLKVGIAIYGLVPIIGAFVAGDAIAGIFDIALVVACIAIVHFAGALVLTPLNDRIALLLGNTDVEMTCRDQREWERKQVGKGYFDGRRSVLDAEVQHIKESLGVPGNEPARTRQRGR